MTINSNILYGNETEEKIKKITSKGKELIHILSDFDRTLTYARVNEKDTPSIISVLYNEGYLSEEYSNKAKALAEIYRPIENDLSIPIETRKEKMLEWRGKHRKLLIESKLSIKHIQQVVDTGIIKFRDGSIELLEMIDQANIPVVIMSASGLGEDSISIYLQKNLKKNHNIHIISNGFVRDENGIATSYKEPIVTSLNKDETIISQENFPIIHADISKRKNIILLGDQISDIDMASGFDYDTILKIGFLNEASEEKIKIYQNHFDIVILGDSGMEEVVKITKKILE